MKMYKVWIKSCAVYSGCVELLVSVCHRIIPYIKERSDQSDINIPCLTLNSVLDSIQHLLKYVHSNIEVK